MRKGLTVLNIDGMHLDPVKKVLWFNNDWSIPVKFNDTMFVYCVELGNRTDSAVQYESYRFNTGNKKFEKTYGSSYEALIKDRIRALYLDEKTGEVIFEYEMFSQKLERHVLMYGKVTSKRRSDLPADIVSSLLGIALAAITHIIFS